MNNLIKIKIAMLFMACGLLITSCEKEGNDILPNSAQNTNSKSSATPTKSGGGFPSDYWDNLQQFIFDVMEGNDLSDMEIEKALYYTESTMDWRLANVEEDNIIENIRGEQLSFTIDNLTSVNGGSYNIEAVDLTSFNQTVYNSIVQQANHIADSVSDTVMIETIDFTWTLNGSSVDANVNVLYGVIGVLPQVLCNWHDTKFVIKEDCNMNPFRNHFKEVNLKTRPLDCGPWVDKLNCSLSNHIIINPAVRAFNGLTPCGSFLPSAKDSKCFTALDNQNVFNDVRATWNTVCMPRVLGSTKLRKCLYYPQYGISGITDTQAWASFHTAECKAVCTLPTCVIINRPHKPTFQPE